MDRLYVLIAAAIVVAAASWWYYTSLNIETAHNESAPTVVTPRGGHEESPPETAEPISAHGGEDALATYTCASGKSLIAVYMRDIVDLTLSDGRQLTLHQVEAASGIRYTDAEARIEFSSKDYGASLQEGDRMTFTDCVLQ